MKPSILGALIIGLFIGIAIWAATHRRAAGPELKKVRGMLKAAQHENDSLREQLKAKNDSLTLLRSTYNQPN
jgi:uncharacterized membrane-anchored protein YhcB (DUF1043 family)